MVIFSKTLNVCALILQLLCSFHFFTFHARFCALIFPWRYSPPLLLFSLIFPGRFHLKLTVMLQGAERKSIPWKEQLSKSWGFKTCYIIIHATIHLFLMTVMVNRIFSQLSGNSFIHPAGDNKQTNNNMAKLNLKKQQLQMMIIYAPLGKSLHLPLAWHALTLWLCRSSNPKTRRLFSSPNHLWMWWDFTDGDSVVSLLIADADCCHCIVSHLPIHALISYIHINFIHFLVVPCWGCCCNRRLDESCQKGVGLVDTRLYSIYTHIWGPKMRGCNRPIKSTYFLHQNLYSFIQMRNRYCTPWCNLVTSSILSEPGV